MTVCLHPLHHLWHRSQFILVFLDVTWFPDTQLSWLPSTEGKLAMPSYIHLGVVCSGCWHSVGVAQEMGASSVFCKLVHP